MGNLSDLWLAPKAEEKSLDQLVETCSSGSWVPEDCISYLPDDILLVILSLLTMNQVAKINLLSRRLLNMSRHTPVLIFLKSYSFNCLNFVKWVNHTLERHKGQYLKEFKIVCDLDCESKKDIKKWVIFALSRKVERLELNFLSSGFAVMDFYADNYLFSERLLQYDLKCLKWLSLKNMYVSNKAINFFLINCPFLEGLELVGIHNFDFTHLVISGPDLVLKHLQIKGCLNFKVLSISNANLVSLDIPSLGDNLTLIDLPMLVELSISGERGMRFSKSYSLTRVGSCFHSQLEAVTLWGLQAKDIFDLHYLARMTKLKRLVIEIDVMGRDDESLTMFISIIHSCPCLEEFILMLCVNACERNTRNIYYVEADSSLLQSKSLKVFQFLGYFGHARDVELIIHILENALCLEKIIIDPRRQYLGEDPCYSESVVVQKARSFAMNQLEALRETQSIPPHVNVLIR